MGKNTEFPWDLLKAESLRVVCSQLVQGSRHELNTYPPGRKEDMIEFLRDVQARNCRICLLYFLTWEANYASVDAAVSVLQSHNRSQHKPAGSDEASSPSKRKSDRLEEGTNEEGGAEGIDGYNTRYKGVKRVKVKEATPERTSRSPRKVARPRKSITKDAHKLSKRAPRKSVDGSISTFSVKKGRGRPRKSAPEGGAVIGNVSTEKGAGKKAKETADGEAKESASTVYRGRGRPRKSDVTTASKAPVLDVNGNPKRSRGRPRKSVTTVKPPLSKGKQVFEGVILEKRKTTPKDQGAVEPELEAIALSEDEEEDAVLAAINAGNLDGDGASSLAGSNKGQVLNKVEQK